MGAMPTDPFIREKFTRERTAAKKLAEEFSSVSRKSGTRLRLRAGANCNIEFTMKRLREPIEKATEIAK